MTNWMRSVKWKVQPFKFVVISFALFAAFVFTSNLRNTVQYSLYPYRFQRDVQENRSKYSPSLSITSDPLLQHHPFDNTCKFPIPNIYAHDINTIALSERFRKYRCPITKKDFASMDSEGFIYVHPNHVNYPQLDRKVNCSVDIIEGGLRQPHFNMTKDKFKVVKTMNVPSSERLFINADAFIIKCFNTSKNAENADKPVWTRPFPGMKDRNLPENEVLRVKDLQSYGDYGNKLRAGIKKEVGRYSIDILGFDSTARTMFMRHLPRSVETMEKLGYHFLYGYNKVADNSMVNLAPILIGDIPEALAKPRHDQSGDVNIDWILPTHDRMDPTKLNFLWKIMKEKYGCVSLFNEDISMKSLGLFNYPPVEFQPGFKESPADHYYRAYYLAVYQDWKYSACKNGEQLQNEFVEIWKRFAHRYKDICHFGFTFVTTLTHESSFALELMDEKLSAHLAQLHLEGSLDNTMSIIMGDHGNRIGHIQHTYTGRIEERMPLMAIRLPTGFKEKYPKEYNNFLENKFKLTSNFDIHQTLKDIVHMRLGDQKTSQGTEPGRGVSLFDAIPSNRSCYEAYIPENFCTCMVDVSNITNPLPKVTKKAPGDQKKDQLVVLKKWLTAENLAECVDEFSLKALDDFKEMAINPLARFGLRSKSNLTVLAKAIKSQEEKPKLNFLNFEFTVTGSFKNKTPLKMLVRTELFVETNESRLVFEPMMQTVPEKCSFVSIFDVCHCLASNSP